jgi:3-(3-hydroxy-phenyl)propionate hydroxylase
VRTPQGRIGRSDDVLGPAIALVGFGEDPAACLPADVQRRWTEVGATTVTIAPEDGGEQRPSSAYVVLEDARVSRLVRQRWCAVVRPDRTVLHDGPAAEAARIASDVLALLATGDAGSYGTNVSRPGRYGSRP